EVLDLVAVSPFYGQPVAAPGSGDPNMLDSAMQKCGQVLGHERVLLETSPRPKLDGVGEAFARGVAHYERWESLCTFNNEPVVFVFTAGGDNPTANSSRVYRAKDESSNWIYPTDQLVGNQFGGIDVGIQGENT